MFDDFFLRALIAGILIACIAGFLGCFVVWRRMAYFGDSLAHSALPGIAVGLVASQYGFSESVASMIGIIIVCSLCAIILTWLQQLRILATDTLLGIMAHSSLSLGMIAISLMNLPNVDLHSYLFGDLLTVGMHDIAWIALGGVVIFFTLHRNWQRFLLITIHEDLAKAEGIPTTRLNMLLMLLIAIAVALSIRIVGILLITSLLIIPAATARQLVTTPLQMAMTASLLAVCAMAVGLCNSLWLDIPSGASVVAVATGFFVLVLLCTVIHQNHYDRRRLNTTNT